MRYWPVVGKVFFVKVGFFENWMYRTFFELIRKDSSGQR